MRAWLRPRDRLIACELEPRTAAALGKNLATSTRAKVLAIDGWTALSAYLPPKERRGLVLIDPPYEAPDEFARLAEAFKQAQRKWASGIYLLWYPIKDRSGPDALAKRLKALRIGKILRAEMTIARVPAARPSDSAAGLIVVNPPWTLERELAVLLPALAGCLAPGARRLPFGLAGPRNLDAPAGRLFPAVLLLVYRYTAGWIFRLHQGGPAETEAVGADASPIRSPAEPSYRRGRAAMQLRGEEFPDGADWYCEIFQ